MKPGDKFRAIRKSNNKPAFKGILNPKGFVFTAEYERDGIITCTDENVNGHPYQIFTKFFDVEVVTN
jgi:hypothetical protein